MTLPHGKLASTAGFDELFSVSHAAPCSSIVLPPTSVQSVPYISG